MTDIHNLREARVTVVGLGIEGIDLVRFLSHEGAQVTVSDARPADDLAEQLAAIADCDGVTLSLGANRVEDAVHADAVFVSQGVPDSLPALRAAEERGVPISSMTELFLARCPAPVTGITGSSGKTTTTALVDAMLARSGQDYVMGGNIGVGLLSLLPDVRSDTRVLVELSHTQLARVEVSPHIACVTNVTPNHLDRYSWEDYVDLKRRIFIHQGPDDLVILNLDNAVTRGFIDEAPGRVATTSRRERIAGDGAMVADGRVVRVLDGVPEPVIDLGEIPLRGDHNLENVVNAVAVAAQIGVDSDAMADAIRAFTGVPHRLEPIATVRGVLYVNDSIATTPERTVAGMRSFEEPLVLILGGRDKQLPTSELAEEIAARCRAVVTFGEAAELYANVARTATADEPVGVRLVADVASAVVTAAELARPGDVVLFAPAGTSFDAFRNFELRGRAFREAVERLEDAV
jgi:UDP-N-acetylmuramoylalanine--D-glutamate ligase